MKILIVTAFPPNQKTAGQDYTCRMINELLKSGHELSLIYALYPGHNAEVSSKVKIIATIKPSIFNCLKKITYHPFFTRRFEFKILNIINKIKNDFDILYFDFSQVHIYAKYIKHPNKILMCHDIIAQKYSRGGGFQHYWILPSEEKLLKSANKIFTFSKKDCDYLYKCYNLPSSNVNFYLKTGRFKYDSLIVNKKTFCFYGAWNREENIESLQWFINNVLPLCNANVKYKIIGGGMSNLIKSEIQKYPCFEILGFVDNPIHEIALCEGLIAPLHKGAGVKVKVIDALLSGTSVIGTDVTFEGITDNIVNKLFNYFSLPKELADIINNWQSKTIMDRQNAADEFFERYNRNHFEDYLNDLKAN